MSADPTAVRPMREKDFDGFHRCFDAVVREGGAFQFVETPPAEGLRRFLTGAIERGETLFVAKDADAVVGWIEVLRRRGTTIRHNGDLTIALLAPYRGRGLGSRLMKLGLEHARDRGIEVVRLQVFSSNRAAIRLYERFGFTVDGVQRDAVRCADRVEDYTLMSLDLDDPSISAAASEA